MATIERIPRHSLGRRSGQKTVQSPKTAEVSRSPRESAGIALLSLCCVVLAGILLAGSSGCQSSQPHSLFSSQVRNSQIGSRNPIRDPSDSRLQSDSRQTRGAKPNPESDPTQTPTTLSADGSNIRLTSFQESDSDQESAPEVVPPTASDISRNIPQNIGGLTQGLVVDDVIRSVADCYPLIEIAMGEIETATGKIISSWGEFDTTFRAHSINQPLGFYQTFQQGVQVNRQLYGGGEIYGSYRIGDGDFEPWYGERETNEAGEFKAGLSIPLIKDRAIDKRRAKLLAARLSRNQLESNVESRLLVFQRIAAQAYWKWVAAGQVVRTQKQLLDFAKARVKQIEGQVEFGEKAKFAKVDNDRFIAKRETELVKARRKFENAAIKLSLFYRDANCSCQIATEEQLPTQLPITTVLSVAEIEAGIATAVSQRPETQELAAAEQRAQVELNYGRNLTLPKLDVKGFAGQDIGGAASSKGDKTPFELQVGLFAEVPLQRREGIGKIRSAEGKLIQLRAKQQFLVEKITAEILDVASAVNAAVERIELSERNVRLTTRALEFGNDAYLAGELDLIDLNIYETSVADAQLQLITARQEYFEAKAAFDAAILNTAF